MTMGAQLSEEKPYTSQRLTRVSLLANSIGSPGWRIKKQERSEITKKRNNKTIQKLYKKQLYTINTNVNHHGAEVLGAPVVDALNGGAGCH